MDWIRSARKTVWRDKRKVDCIYSKERQLDSKESKSLPVGMSNQGDHDPW